MSLLTYQWQEPDPTGVVNAWLSGLASAQHDQALQQAQAAAVAHSIQEQAKLQQQREHEERLLRAEDFRQQLLLEAQTPYVDPYATSGAREAGVVPGSPIHAPAVAVPMATAATPQDGASIVLGTPSPGASLIQGANAGDNAALSTMDALGGGAAPGLTLAQPNPNAAAVSLGAPVQFPSPVAAGAQVAAAPPVSEMDRQSKILEDRLNQALARGENPDQVSLRESDMAPVAPGAAAATGAVTPADMVLAGGSDFSKPIDMLAAANPAGGMLPVMSEAAAANPGLPIDWIKQQEGFKPRAFQDGKQLSIGYGTKAQSPNETITPEEATDRLTKELSDSARSVDNAADKAGMKLTPAQREALISYDFNTGKGAAAITQSGGDPRAVASSILHGPVTQDGRVLPGLVTRRRTEYARFMSDVAPMPDDATVAPPAPGTGAAAALATTASDPASQVLAAGQAELRRLSADLAARRVPAKVAQAALNQEQQKISAAVLAASKPDKARNIDPLSPEGLKARSALEAAKNSPEAIAAAAAKAKAVAEARVNATVNGEPLRWEGETGFTKGGKAYRYDNDGVLQPVTGKMQYGSMEEQLAKDGFSLVGKPGYENVVTNKDGSLLQTVAQGVNGKLTYKPYSSAGKIEHVGDSIVRVMPDNSVVTLTKIDKVAGADQKGLTDAMKEIADAQDGLVKAQNAKDQWFSAGKIKAAQDKVTKAQGALGVYVQKYPFLQNTVGKALPDGGQTAPPAPSTPAPAAPSADPASDPGAFTAAFAAAKSGDVLTFQGKQYRKP